MKKFSVFSVMLVCLLALGLVLVACDNGGGGGVSYTGGYQPSGGNDNRTVYNEITLTVVNNDLYNVVRLEVRDTENSVVYAQDYSLKIEETKQLKVSGVFTDGSTVFCRFYFNSSETNIIYSLQGGRVNGPAATVYVDYVPY